MNNVLELCSPLYTDSERNFLTCSVITWEDSYNLLAVTVPVHYALVVTKYLLAHA